MAPSVPQMLILFAFCPSPVPSRHAPQQRLAGGWASSSSRLSVGRMETSWMGARAASSISVSRPRHREYGAPMMMEVPGNDVIQYPTIFYGEANDGKWINASVRPSLDYIVNPASEMEIFPLIMHEGSPRPYFLSMIMEHGPPMRTAVLVNDVIQYPTISSEEANDLKSKGWIHIDVRPEQDYKLLHAPDSENFPLALADGSPNPDFLPMMLKAHPDKDKVRLLVSCKGGFRSPVASKILIEAGYKNVINVDGGIIRWQAKGLPVM